MDSSDEPQQSGNKFPPIWIIITVLAIVGIIAAKTGHLTLSSFMNVAGMVFGFVISAVLLATIVFWLIDVLKVTIKARAVVVPIIAVLALLGVLAAGAGGTGGFIMMAVVVIAGIALVAILGGS